MRYKMKLLKITRTGFILVLLAFFLLSVQAQGQTENATDSTKTDKTEDKKQAGLGTDNQGTYLDVYHAKEASVQLKKQNIEDIHRLKIMVKNFGTSEEQESFKKITDGYKEGIKFYYKSKLIESEKRLKENQKNIIELFASLANGYNERASEILSNCADKLVDVELAATLESGQIDTAKNGIISKTRIRLVVAYNQLNDGEKYQRAERPDDAISHYRLAAYHGVNILTDLAETQEEKAEIRKKYNKQMIDSENRIAPEEGKES